jgi:ornithine cyclodeaminase/alanine dehydrogenase-like protein (mu-crystallin family)
VTLRMVGPEDIERTMSITAAADVLATMFSSAHVPPPAARQHLPFADGELLVMTAVNNPESGASSAGVKVVTVRNANLEIGMPSVSAVYVFFGGPALAPLALIDGAALTAFRTCAVSALATRMLAREDASRLVIFGAGAQAAAHLRAMAAVRPISHVTVINENAARASRLIEIGRALDVEVCRGGMADVVEADIVCTCTTSATPVIDGKMLSPGTHINAIGSYHPDVRELDDVTARRGRWFVEERERVFEESGDVLLPIANGEVGAGFVVDDLFGLCRGSRGRTSEEEITIFKSVGLAIEDLAIANALIRAHSD